MAYHMYIFKHEFEWDHIKNTENLHKHGVSFIDAQLAFLRSSESNCY